MMRFPSKIQVSVRRYGTNEVYYLVRADSVAADEGTLARLVSICNEPHIYHWLFQELCAAEPYTASHARQWLDWARSGWRDHSHFAFVVRDPDENIVAACDIKSNCRENAEIGYWCSASATGVMTNAVREMLSMGVKAGFQSYVALTRPGNVRSEGVLHRLGFSKDDSGRVDGQAAPHQRWKRTW